MAKHLVPACDRCGRSTDLNDLVPDDLGPLCPDCRAGSQPTPQEAHRGA